MCIANLCFSGSVDIIFRVSIAISPLSLSLFPSLMPLFTFSSEILRCRCCCLSRSMAKLCAIRHIYARGLSCSNIASRALHVRSYISCDISSASVLSPRILSVRRYTVFRSSDISSIYWLVVLNFSSLFFYITNYGCKCNIAAVTFLCYTTISCICGDKN